MLVDNLLLASGEVKRRNVWKQISLLFLLTMITFILSGKAVKGADNEIVIPTQSDWIDYGQVFESGPIGEWDYILWGGFTNTAVKKDGQFYLYYQGSSDYQMVPDETVLWRSIGVATSSDGINFEKHSENPVLTWFPTNVGEEGATSGGVTLDENGGLVMAYGANTAFRLTEVHADGRLATSTDGLNFNDQGIVLNYRDNSIWGYGDELFPVAMIHDAGQWFVYYLPNGTAQARKLGVAWGPALNQLDNSAAVLEGSNNVNAWGTAGYGEVAPDVYALFTNNVAERTIEVRLVDLQSPATVGPPVETYQFDGVSQGTVILDQETNTWFMFYRNIGSPSYGVKVAPAGDPDQTPPSPPPGLQVEAVDDRRVDLNWQPAEDVDTGIAFYKVFRGNQEIATVKGWSFRDSGLSPETTYEYSVASVNYHGTAGTSGSPVSVTTLPDTTAPTVKSVHANGDLTHITVVFSEAIDPITGSQKQNYPIQGLCVQQAIVAEPDTVVLETCSQIADALYSLRVRRVQDQATPANKISGGNPITFTASTFDDLIGEWRLDGGPGNITPDTSNFASDGIIAGGPESVPGINGEALFFDGNDDHVIINGAGWLENKTDDNYAVEAWARPENLPPYSTNNDAYYTIFARQYNGLYYDYQGHYQAKVGLVDGSQVVLSSPVLSPGEWHQVMMVVDNMAGSLSLFIDGQEVAGSPVQFTPGMLADLEDAPYYIGTSEPLDNFYEYRFHGGIDHVRMFSPSS